MDKRAGCEGDRTRSASSHSLQGRNSSRRTTFRTHAFLRRLTARLTKLEQASAGRPKTMHYIFHDDEGAYEVLTSRPGKGTETSYVRDAPKEDKGDTFGSDGGE